MHILKSVLACLGFSGIGRSLSMVGHYKFWGPRNYALSSKNLVALDESHLLLPKHVPWQALTWIYHSLALFKEITKDYLLLKVYSLWQIYNKSFQPSSSFVY